jgi:linearmycin/streptolysin S transport system permease protein
VIAIIGVNLRRSIGNRRVLLVATLIPVLIILITGLVSGSPKEPVGLVNPSHRLVQLIDHTQDMKIRIEHSRASLDDDILRSRVVAGLIELPAKGDAIRVDFVLETATTDAIQAHTDVVALLDLLAAEGSATSITQTTVAHTHTTAPLSPFAYVAPADLVLFMGITLLLLSQSIVEGRRLGIIRRLATAPVNRPSIAAAQIISLLVTGGTQAIGLLFIGRVLFGVHWGNPFTVFLVLLLLSLALSGASTILGSVSRSQEQAVALSVVFGIVAGMLGGCVYQLDTVSNAVREVGHVVPQAWAMDALIKMIYDQAGFMSLLPEIGALAAFAVVLNGLAYRVYTRRMFVTVT